MSLRLYFYGTDEDDGNRKLPERIENHIEHTKEHISNTILLALRTLAITVDRLHIQ